MLTFIATNLLMVAVGVVLYLLVRSLPRIEEDTVPSHTFIQRWLASEIPERLDTILHSFSTKFLRRTRLVVLKIDNALSGKLKDAVQRRTERTAGPLTEFAPERETPLSPDDR